MMVSLPEILDRISSGEKIDEKEYDMRIFRKTSELVKEFDVRCDPNNPVPADNQLADEVYEAGLRLASEVGGYCLDARRGFRFTEGELREALGDLPEEIVVGQGRDTRKISVRKIEDQKIPHVIGIGSTPFTEEYAVPLAESAASLAIDSFRCPNMWYLEGRRIVNMPLEVYGTRREVEWAREGLRRGGKPGLHMTSYPLRSTAAVSLSILDDDHVRRTDAVSAAGLPELFKIDYDTITVRAMAREYGCFIFDHISGFAGGMCGGYEGAVISEVAGAIISNAVMEPDYNLLYISNVTNWDLINSQECLWASNLAHQAVARNTRIKMKGLCMASAEPSTEQWFLECILGIGRIVSGISVVTAGGRPNRPKRENLGGPIEIEWGIRLAHAGAKLSRQQANDIAKDLVMRLPQEKLGNPPRGKTFPEAYDKGTLRPKEELQELYDNAWKQAEELGLVLD